MDLSTLGLIGTVSILVFLATAIGVPILIVRLPADYFAKPDPPERERAGLKKAAWISFLILRNVLGILLILAGVFMMVAPGPGVLGIIAGLMLTNLPGKRRLILKIVGQKQVLAGMNGLRRRYNKPPFEIPAADA